MQPTSPFIITVKSNHFIVECLVSQGMRSYVDLQAQMIFINPNQEINVELHPKYTMHATSVVAFRM